MNEGWHRVGDGAASLAIAGVVLGLSRHVRCSRGRMKRFSFAALLFTLLVVTAGCSSQSASATLCDRVYEADCAYPGGKSECVARFEDVEDRASARGCGSEIEALYDCLGKNVSDSCDSDPEVTCPSEAAALDGCDTATR